jgi:hypothetical protein
MCTLIIGQDVLGPRTVLFGTNRDERFDRPSQDPAVLNDRPRVVGGRDLQARGTWLALREGRAAVALLNRRPPPDLPPRDQLRSRGLLTLEVAAAPEAAEEPGPDDFAEEKLLAVVQSARPQLLAITGSRLGLGALQLARRQAREQRFAPFSLVWMAPEGSWAYMLDETGRRRAESLAPGWHVMAHDDADDRREPRVAWLLDALAGWKPRDFDQARERLQELLASHGKDGAPPVCLHGGYAGTVSAAIVFLGAGAPRYLHAPGSPCTNAFQDYSALLAPPG